ncbi:MAG: uridine kinase [Planctomycetaceae bacterium]|nr:uridine kinase [Planctomycetaceae bacterium]
MIEMDSKTVNCTAGPQLSHIGFRPIVIGISGASCSGKSWLAEKIHGEKVNESQIIDLDGYYRELDAVAQLEHGHDNPDSINFEQALSDLRQLKAGQESQFPIYCYEQHKVKGFRLCSPTPVILVEGLFIFAHQQLRAEIDIKIWIETCEELRFTRRVQRDTSRRSRTVDEIRERYECDVIPGFQKFIKPLREHADIIVGNDGRDASQSPLFAKLVVAYVEQLSATHATAK